MFSRYIEIKEPLLEIIPQKNYGYTNEELKNILLDFQREMANLTFAVEHANSLRPRDLMLHLSILAKKYRLDTSEEFKRLVENFDILQHTIAILISGINGEKDMRRALKLLASDYKVNILYNITLTDGEDKTEYDAIVIAPYGVYVIEAKNYRHCMLLDERGIFIDLEDDSKEDYNLGERMNCKEMLLRKILGDKLRVPYKGFLLFSNNKAKLDNRYDRIPVVYNNTISHEIRDCKSEDVIPLTNEEIEDIKDTILESKIICKTICELDCEQIATDFALVMANIEECASQSVDFYTETDNKPIDIGISNEERTNQPKDYWNSTFKKIDLYKVTNTLVAASGISAFAALVYYGLKKFGANT